VPPTILDCAAREAGREKVRRERNKDAAKGFMIVKDTPICGYFSKNSMPLPSKIRG
jgi:hypothetical protein